MMRPLTSMLRSDLLALAYAAVAAAAIGLHGLTLASAGLPAALLVGLLAYGMARPGSSLLYPTVSHGPRHGRQVSLSFDDGPDSEVTPAVLDALSRYGARATFFTIGRQLQANGPLARRLVAEGHELANHSWSHSRWHNFFGLRRHLHEIGRARQVIASYTGGTGQPLFRSPMGHKSPPLALAARQLDLTLVAWSLHAHDTGGDSAAQVARRVLDRIVPGDIVLMHDGHDRPGHHRPVCAQALPLILAGLREKNLQCVTISELLRPAGRGA